MKAPKKINRQDAEFAKKRKIPPKETPIADFFRKVIFFTIVIGGLWFLYDFTWRRLQVEQTIKEVAGLEQSVRALTPHHRLFNDTANLEFLLFSGHIDKDMYNENTKLGKNRFGGALVVMPQMGGTMFSVEVSGIPSYVCKRMMKRNWGNSVTLESVRVGGKVFSWSDETLPMKPADIDEYCTCKNSKFKCRKNILFMYK